jgi:hypothetical protein
MAAMTMRTYFVYLNCGHVNMASAVSHHAQDATGNHWHVFEGVFVKPIGCFAASNYSKLWWIHQRWCLPTLGLDPDPVVPCFCFLVKTSKEVYFNKEFSERKLVVISGLDQPPKNPIAVLGCEETKQILPGNQLLHVMFVKGAAVGLMYLPISTLTLFATIESAFTMAALGEGHLEFRV